MTQICALLGAGITADIGGIMANELTNELTENSIIKQIYNDLKSNKENDFNFEDIFFLLELITSAKSGEPAKSGELLEYTIFDLKEKYNNFNQCELCKAKNHVIDTITSKVRDYSEAFDSNKDKQYDFFVSFWKNAIKDNIWTIFTLNYDLIFESFLEKYVDGFINDAQNSDVQKFSIEEFNSNKNETKLIHLHGCINYGPPIRDVHHNNRQDNDVSCKYLEETIEKFMAKANESNAGYETTDGIYLNTGSIITGLRKFEKMIVSPYWTYFCEFMKSISSENSWLIAGYSFNDAHLNYLLRKLSNDNYTRRIVIIAYVKDIDSQISLNNLFPQKMLETIGAIVHDEEISLTKVLPKSDSVKLKNSNVKIYLCTFERAIKEHGGEIMDFLRRDTIRIDIK